RHGDTANATPTGLDQNFTFEHETGRTIMPDAHLIEQCQRIDAESRLAVANRIASGPRDPEVRKAIRPITGGGNLFRGVQARADHDVVRQSLVSLDEARDVLGIM